MIPIVQISDIPKSNSHDIKTSPFIDTLKSVRWYFDAEQNVSYIFDHVKVTDTFPFTYCNLSNDKEYTKVLNNFTQIHSLIDNIQIFNAKNDNVEKLNEKYVNYIIGWFFNGVDFQRILITEKFIEFQQTVPLNLNIKDIILDYVELAKIDDYINDERIMKTKGTFYLWNIPKFNKNLFLDFIMNNDVARKFMIIRENGAIKKEKKENIKLSFIYPSKHGQILINMSFIINVLEKGQPIFKTRNWIDIGIGNTYLSINMSTHKNNIALEELNITSSVINKILSTFAKVINIYGDTVDDIYDAYKIFVNKEDLSFISTKKVTKTNITLKNKAPEMFVVGYPRVCQKHQNGYLREIKVYDTKEEALDAIGDKELTYMAYPADEEYLEYVKNIIGDHEILTPIPINHRPYYFVCDNEKHTVPALTENKLANKQLFPYLPCCFAASKNELKPGAALWKYLHGIHPSDQSTTTMGNVTIKGKIQLKPNVKGPLSLQIQDVFKIIKPNYKFMRIGVKGSNNSSFLSCLNKAIGINIDMDDVLSNDEHLINVGLLKQNNYDMNIQDICNMLLDDTIYMNPRRVVTFFEYILNINIVLFGDVKVNDTYETTIIQPRNKFGHYEWEHNRKETVLIYLSTGSNHIQEERCELIIAENESKTITVFNRSIYDYLRYISSNVYNQYSLFTPYQFFALPAFFSKIKYQSIDTYGKVYRIQIDDYTIDTQPLPPIPNVKQKKLNVKLITDDNTLLELLNEAEYIIRENKIIINKNNINFVVYWNQSPSIINIQKYVGEKHCANVLKDIFVYLFSNYLNEYISALPKSERKKYKITEHVDRDFIMKFSETIDIVNEDDEDNTTSYLVKHPPKFFKYKNYSNFQYPNKSCKIRLIYYLSLLIKHNPFYVLDYKNKIYLDHYYTCIYDFTQNPNYYITSSLDSLKYINNNYEIKDTIDRKIDKPYFIFASWTTRKTPVLTMNMLSLKNAIKLSTFWHDYRYIPQINEDGKFVYPEEFNIEYIKSNESKYTLLNLDDTSDLQEIIEQNSDAKVNKHIIATKSYKIDENEESLFCPLLY